MLLVHTQHSCTKMFSSKVGALMRREFIFPWSATTPRRRTSSSCYHVNGYGSQFISYLTDVEGDLAYWKRFVRNSKVLSFLDDGEESVQLDPRAILVYGGDVWDKGGSDLTVLQQLLDLKRRYPDRVFFIMGNRDINKMRLWQELLAVRHDGVWWNRTVIPPHDTHHRLPWILANTMGSPKAYDLRRSELQRKDPLRIITENDVRQSYLDSCHPVTGQLGQYLSQAHLILRLGNVLFLHGALPWMKPEDPRFPLPWLDNMQDESINSPHKWMDALNEFAKSQLEEWQLDVQSMDQEPPNGCWATVGGFSYWPSTSNHRYSGLMQYGMGWLPDQTRIPTIVYSSWSKDGMPRRFFASNDSTNPHWFVDRTRRFFEESDLQVVLSGHQPQGDWPTPINIGDGKLILCCDTSYSGDVEWHHCRESCLVGGRGEDAVCEVLLEQCAVTGNVKAVTMHGIMSDGQRFATRNLIDSDAVGKLALPEHTPDDRPWWVKASGEEGELLLYTGEGYNVVNLMLAAHHT